MMHLKRLPFPERLERRPPRRLQIFREAFEAFVQKLTDMRLRGFPANDAALEQA